MYFYAKFESVPITQCAIIEEKQDRQTDREEDRCSAIRVLFVQTLHRSTSAFIILN